MSRRNKLSKRANKKMFAASYVKTKKVNRSAGNQQGGIRF